VPLGAQPNKRGQVLTRGEKLFEAHGTEAVEVEVGFQPDQLRRLLPATSRRRLQSGMTMPALRELFDLEVTVTLRSGDWVARWPGRFDRIREVVDPRLRTIHLVVVVDDPYEQVIPGVRPALVRGMYCEIELRAPARPQTVVLPRSALREGRVFILDEERRLRARAVETAFQQDDLVVIAGGLQGGERVIVSDPAPAIEGMQVEPVDDPELQQRLIDQAEGKEDDR